MKRERNSAMLEMAFNGSSPVPQHHHHHEYHQSQQHQTLHQFNQYNQPSTPTHHQVHSPLMSTSPHPNYNNGAATPTPSSSSTAQGIVPPEVFRQGIIEHAITLGMNPETDMSLLWIAEQSLLAPLPSPWVQFTTDQGQVYFYNEQNGDSSWDHPSDEYYRQLYRERKEKMTNMGEVEKERNEVLDNSRSSSPLKESSPPDHSSPHSPKIHSKSNNRIGTKKTGSQGSIASGHGWEQIMRAMKNCLSQKEEEDHIDETTESNSSTNGEYRQRLDILNMIQEVEGVLNTLKQKDCGEYDGSKAQHFINTEFCNDENIVSINNDDYTSLIQRNKELEQKVNQYCQSSNDLQKRIDEIESKSDEEKHCKSLAEWKELEVQVRDKDAIIQRLRETETKLLEDSKIKINSFEKELKICHQEIEDKEVLVKRLNRELEEEQRSAASKNGQNDTLKSKMDALDGECISLREELAHTKDSLEETLTCRNELRDKVKQLSSAVDDINKSKDEVVKDIERVKILLGEAKESAAVAGRNSEKYLNEMKVWEKKYKEERKRTRKLNNSIIELQVKALVYRHDWYTGNIRVLCRVRPLSGQEQREVIEDKSAPDMQRAIQYLDDGKLIFHEHEYEYDRVFAPGAIQGSVFAEVASAVASSMDGHSVCIFAYGQTGSGKTHTMEGTKDDRGVNYRALEELFTLAKAASTEVKYKFLVSVIEVYNERVCDLLVQPSSNGSTCNNNHDEDATRNCLEIRMRKDEVYVDGLSEQVVENCNDVEKIMSLASTHRRTASNGINEHSSRSHLVLSIKVSGKNISTGSKISGKLNMIDLAGSERLKSTSASGQRLKEAQNINRSLSALGDVISALGSKRQHIPYRNSKLTFLLQDSLRSNARVLMFVNINPAHKSSSESICSLNFASRCRAVQLGKSRKDCTPTRG